MHDPSNLEKGFAFKSVFTAFDIKPFYYNYYDF